MKEKITVDLDVFFGKLVELGLIDQENKIISIVYPDPDQKVFIHYEKQVHQKPKTIIKYQISDTSEEDKINFLDLEIGELDISCRVYRLLKNRFACARDLTQTNKKYLKKIMGMGEKSISEIERILALNGFELKNE